MTEEAKIELLLQQKTMTDIVLAVYLMILNDKGLFKEADEFVKGFLACMSKEERETLYQQKKQRFEEEAKNI